MLKHMGKIILAILFLIGLTGLGYYLIQQDRQDQIEQMRTSDIAPDDSASSATSHTPEEVETEGIRFSDPHNRYTLIYPNDYIQDVQKVNGIVRFYKYGPTQQEDTELYDGVIVTIQTIDLKNENLNEYVDNQIAQTSQNGVAEITESKSKTIVNGYPGYTYSTRSIGEAKNIFLQQNDSSFAVWITTIVADPGNIGFQSDVDSILNTFTFLND